MIKMSLADFGKHTREKSLQAKNDETFLTVLKADIMKKM
jgi:hypothetical protein